MTLATGLYALYLPSYFVGYFGDDAMYLAAAKSLIQGRFVYLYLPHQAPITQFFPGFPLVLVPFFALFGSHWAWYKLISVAFIVGAGCLTWKLFEGWISPFSRIGLLALWAWNPMTALNSGIVLSDPCYVFAVIGAFLLFRVLLRKPGRLAWNLLLGVCLAWAVSIRPMGACLLMAIALGLIYERRWKNFLQTFGVALPLWLAMMLRNYFLAKTATSYLRQWQMEVPASAHLGTWMRSTFHLGDRLFGDVMLGWEGFAATGGSQIVRGGIILLGAGLVFLGFRRFSKNRGIPEGITLAMGCFVFLHFLVHSLWTAFDYRYLLPLLPFVLVFCVEGIHEIPKKYKAGTILFSLVITLYAYRHGRTLQDVWGPPSPIRECPKQTFLWIQKLPGKEIIETPRSPTVYLYTDHPAETAPNLEGSDLFRYWRLKTGIAYILYQELPLIVERRMALWRRNMEWVRQHPEQYPLVYQNTQEATAIYRVLPDSEFVRRFEQKFVIPFSHSIMPN